MPLIYASSADGVRRLTAMRCDRCKRDYTDVFDLQEALHVHLTAGFGSEWGDGNSVEVALCDACAVSLLRPYATITRRHDLHGHFVGGVTPDFMRGIEEFVRSAEADDRRPRWLRALLFQLCRFPLPAIVLLRPIRLWLLRLNAEIEAEERMLARRFDLPLR